LKPPLRAALTRFAEKFPAILTKTYRW